MRAGGSSGLSIPLRERWSGRTPLCSWTELAALPSQANGLQLDAASIAARTAALPGQGVRCRQSSRGSGSDDHMLNTRSAVEVGLLGANGSSS